MAVEPEDDELLLDQEQDDGDKPEGQEDEEGKQGEPKPGDEGDDELEVTFGDEPAPGSEERESSVIRTLRERIRELSKRPQAETPKPAEIGPRPTLEECEWDEDKHATAVEAWIGRKNAAAQAETEQERAQRQANEDFQNDVQAWETERQSLKVSGKEEASATVQTTLNPIQMAVLAKAGKGAAKLELGLGLNPAKLAEIASIQDPIKLAYALGELKGKIQMAPRRKAPEPEQIERGNASVTHGGTDKEAERQEKRAMERGGDVSDLLRRNREKRRAAQAK